MKNGGVCLKLQGWSFPYEKEAKSMDKLELSEEIDIAEKHLDRLYEIKNSKPDKLMETL